jgi:hypothetical protein
MMVTDDDEMCRTGERREMQENLVGKLEGKRPLGRPRCR